MLQEIQTRFSEVFQGMVEGAVNSVPQILVGAVLVVLALLVAKGVERLLRAVMRKLRFDALVRRSGIDGWLSRIGIRHSLDDVVPRAVYFILLFLFAREAAAALGLIAISEAIGSVVSYLPRLISAFLILLVGSAIAHMAGRAVADGGRAAGMEFAPVLGRVFTGALLFILVVMVLGQLRVETALLRELTVIVVAGGALGLALSFGLGSRDISRNILSGLYIRKVIRVGDVIEIADRRGRVEAITPTQTILRDGERSFILSNSIFLDSIAER